MTLNAALSGYLSGIFALSSIQQDRLFAEVANQDTPLPYSIFHLEIRDPEPMLEGPPALLEATVEFHSCSADRDAGAERISGYDEVWQLAQVLVDAFSYLNGDYGPAPGIHIESSGLNEMVGSYSAELGLYIVRTNFTVLYRPA